VFSQLATLPPQSSLEDRAARVAVLESTPIIAPQGECLNLLQDIEIHLRLGRRREIDLVLGKVHQRMDS